MTLVAKLQRAGMLLPHLARAVLVIAIDEAALAAAYPALDAALMQRPGYPLVAALPAGPDFARHVARYEREILLPLPYEWALMRMLGALRPTLILLLGPAGAWREVWQSKLRQHGGCVVTAGDGAEAATAALRHLPALPDGRGLRESVRRPRRLARIVRSRAGALLSWMFRGRRIDSWDELRERLGKPDTILCLGNGPSSEDPSLGNRRFDCLFRVNWRWRDRGLLTAPRMVFVGDPRTPNRISNAILAFRVEEEANYVLVRQWLSLKIPRFRYLVFDRLSRVLPDASWRARPTNGAIMVAAAVALRPRRIIVGGIDLYQHPAGRYPGDKSTLDGYVRVHEREVEIAVIREALERFEGEVEILSPILAAAIAGAAMTEGDAAGATAAR